MAELTYRDAVIRGIAQEMARDPDVVFLGEDVAKAGGVFWPETLDASRQFIGQGLGGSANPVSLAMPETVQQGYAPVIAIAQLVETTA